MGYDWKDDIQSATSTSTLATSTAQYGGALRTAKFTPAMLCIRLPFSVLNTSDK